MIQMKSFENSLVDRCMQRCFTEQRENTLVFVANDEFWDKPRANSTYEINSNSLSSTG